MGIKNFRFNVIIRVVALAATIFALFYIIDMQDYYMTPILFGLIIIIQLFALIHYLEKTNRDLTNFLESIRFSDFSRSFQVEGLGQSFDELKNAFNSVINDFQRIRTEKEEHYFYLQNIIQHIGVSIIAYQKNGNVEMINNAAKKLFQIKSLKNLKQLEGWNKELVETLLTMKPAENKQVKVQDEDDLLQLSIYSTEFKLDDKSIILVSIKNIQAELEEQEMEAWQKLIRVLTHEIMNSIAPIASLTSTANLLVSDVSESIQKKLSHDFEKETIDDIKNALNTIHKRSTGLIHFVETYRNLTRIPQPNFANFKIKSLFERLINLHTDIFKARRISFAVSISPEELELIADEQLIEQVLVNLIKNSIESIENSEKPTINFTAFINKRGRTTIQVIDNGQGILSEVVDKIFIPFFTTKQSGSGIGLSLSKQILRLHGGTISVQSTPGIETCFTLTF